MRIRQHDFKPGKWRCFGKAPYHLGMELEVEAPDREKRNEGKNIFGNDTKDGQQACIAKRDGSLSEYGWEIVTRPISPEWWLKEKGAAEKVFTLIAGLKGMGYSSHDNGRCGLHVHVCRKAFGPELFTEHFYWFSRLVNGPLYALLSQREPEKLKQWAKQTQPLAEYGVTDYRTPWYSWTNGGSNGRYVACNITSKTVEVRIFRGNLRKDRVKKALQAVTAAVEFSRGRSWFENNDQKALEREFALWVDRRPREYPQLRNYLYEIGYLRAGDVVRAEETQEVLQCA